MRAYGKAWETFDSQGITALFAKDGTYQEKPFKRPYRGHAAIKRYWKKIGEKEKNVHFTLGKMYVEGDTGIAEWKATFKYREGSASQELSGILLATIKRGKIQKFWEYWRRKYTH